MGSGLCGKTPFQEAQVDQWVGFATSLSNNTQCASNMLLTGSTNSACFTTCVKNIKDSLKTLDTHLKGK
jgi:hypothetical protein